MSRATKIVHFTFWLNNLLLILLTGLFLLVVWPSNVSRLALVLAVIIFALGIFEMWYLKHYLKVQPGTSDRFISLMMSGINNCHAG